MLITRIALDPNAAIPQSDLTQMGRTVRVSVDADENSPTVLWTRTSNTLVVQSDVAPEWDLIPGALSATSTKVAAYTAGDRISWSLTANPVRTVATRGADGRTIGRGRKRTLTDQGDVEDWTLGHLDGPLRRVRITRCRYLPRANSAPLRWRLEGTATVADGDALAELQAAGIGRSKSQGCGLLLVQPQG